MRPLDIGSGGRAYIVKSARRKYLRAASSCQSPDRDSRQREWGKIKN